MGSLPVVRCAGTSEPAPGLAPLERATAGWPGCLVCGVPARRSPGRLAMLSGRSAGPARRRGRPARKPPAPARSSSEADPLPHALVEQGVPEALAARREPGPGQGELPGGLGAAGQVAVGARRPSAGTTTSSMPGRPAAGHRDDQVAAGRDRHGVDRLGHGVVGQLRDQVGGLAELRDRRRVVVELLVGGRRRRRRAPAPPVSVLDQAWTAVARSAPPCGEPRVASIPTRSSHAAPWRRSSSIRASRATTPPWEWAMRSIGTPGDAAATCSTRSASRWPATRRSAWVSAAP